MTKVARLTKPIGPGAACYRFGSAEDGHEREYYPSYQSLLNSARALAVVVSVPPYQDAYHLLNFSIECFMKYFYCVVREDVWTTQSPDTIIKTIPALYRRAFSKKAEKLEAGSFGHDIVLLMDTLLSTTEDLDKLDFTGLKRELASDRKSWIADRYKMRQHSVYKFKFERRLRKFEAVLAGTLQRFA